MPDDRRAPDEPLTDDALEQVLVGGMRPTTVVIADYDPTWPVRFEKHRSRIVAALGDRALLVEHIGSTSVPGLAAKPIVDMVVGIADPDDEAAYLVDLEGAGYELRVKEPGHRCLARRQGDDQVNVHCYRPDDDEVHKYLLLRDRLRGDPAERALYEQTKRGLARRRWRDVNYYAEAKGPVIRAILARAGYSSTS